MFRRSAMFCLLLNSGSERIRRISYAQYIEQCESAVRRFLLHTLSLSFYFSIQEHWYIACRSIIEILWLRCARLQPYP